MFLQHTVTPHINQAQNGSTVNIFWTLQKPTPGVPMAANKGTGPSKPRSEASHWGLQGTGVVTAVPLMTPSGHQAAPHVYMPSTCQGLCEWWPSFPHCSWHLNGGYKTRNFIRCRYSAVQKHLLKLYVLYEHSSPSNAPSTVSSILTTKHGHFSESDLNRN